MAPKSNPIWMEANFDLKYCRKISKNMQPLETCRTCLKANGAYRNIFEDTQNNKLISELIMECVPITIQRADKLPDKICKVCAEKLNSVLDFREMVTKSNETLSQRLQNDQFDENEKELKDEIKKELEINAVSGVDIGNNFNGNRQNQTNIDGKIKDELETTETGTTLFKSPNENIPEELYLNTTDTLCDSTECDRGSQINETLLEGVPNKPKYRNYDKKQLKVIIDNPDCRRIVESDLSRQEKSDAKVLCQYCNKLYSFRYYVAIHAHTHMGNLAFKCELCEYRAPVKNILRKHMRMHSQTKNILCTQCGKAFATKEILKAHEVTHSSDTPFNCKICGKAFKRLICLQKHDLIHQNVKEFVCDVCGKSFRQKIIMLNHKAIHTNEKKFECTTCGKEFLLKKRLALHITRHLGLRPFACDICSKRFTDKPTLQKHVLIHTGEKPYSCEVCGKKFRQRSVLPRHMRIHTGETPFPCTVCPQRFKYSHHLMDHMKRHENNKNGEGYQNKKVKKKTENKKLRRFKQELK
ncbi:zinc-finger associated domain containing protein [Oryctes borbonicus]|uniref:Zinc-finger associated domain containing protein n=1 Tax=Oryctes borbonicus TaxID=1629725 RepID=A0A0T6AV64_9SCAR|nr:zinc-finger associated domain containing protein [Oryctes borbonicus]